MCWVCVKFKGVLVGAHSKTQTRAGTGGGRVTASMHAEEEQRRSTGGAEEELGGGGSRSTEGHAHSTRFLCEPKQSCFTHTDRQHTDNTVNSCLTGKQAGCEFSSIGCCIEEIMCR